MSTSTGICVPTCAKVREPSAFQACSLMVTLSVRLQPLLAQRAEHAVAGHELGDAGGLHLHVGLVVGEHAAALEVDEHVGARVDGRRLGNGHRGGCAAGGEERKQTARSGISRDDGIAQDSEDRCQGRDCTPRDPVRQLSVGEQARVGDAEFAQAFHVEVEFLDAGERADAHAMQRACRSDISSRLASSMPGREQHLDAAARILVIGEHAGLDEHGRRARHFAAGALTTVTGWR